MFNLILVIVLFTCFVLALFGRTNKRFNKHDAAFCGVCYAEWDDTHEQCTRKIKKIV